MATPHDDDDGGFLIQIFVNPELLFYGYDRVQHVCRSLGKAIELRSVHMMGIILAGRA